MVAEEKNSWVGAASARLRFARNGPKGRQKVDLAECYASDVVQ